MRGIAPIVLLFAAILLGDFPLLAADAQHRSSPEPWWKHAVIYQVYPRSFYDSDGDGIGDLNGVIAKLDYLKSLGINAIWLNPIYPSPLLDTGYDISDYRSIDPQYGTLADFDRLIVEAKKRDIRIIMDLVLAHTSNQHPWFIQSRSSRNNAKADWYIWRDGKPNGAPPTNWGSFDSRTDSAWEFDPVRGQYFYHLYAKEQPALNWHNPELRKEMIDTARFWLDRGVAGFRLDAVMSMSVDAAFRDNPPPPEDPGERFNWIVFGQYTYNLPEFHEAMRDLRQILSRYDGDPVLIGETDTKTFDDLLGMYGKHHDEIQLPMNFPIFWSKLTAPDWRRQVAEWDQAGIGGWPLYFLSNHDAPRSYSRFADGTHNDEIARLIAVLLLSVRGTPIIYYGEELGMTTSSEDFIRQGMEKGGQLRQPPFDGRDGERTPMQWDASPAAGFTTGTPWLPIPSSVTKYNVASELADPGSILNVYRRMLALRTEHTALQDGAYIPINQDDANVFAYIRRTPGAKEAIAVVLNMSGQSRQVHLQLDKAAKGARLRTLLTTFTSSSRANDGNTVNLPPYGAWVGILR